MSNQIKNRAETPEQKAEVLKRILDCWQESFPSLRLGQMLLNLVEQEYHLYNVEDTTLADRLEEWAARAKNMGVKI